MKTLTLSALIAAAVISSAPVLAGEVSGTMDTNLKTEDIRQTNRGGVNNSNKLDVGNVSKKGKVSGHMKTTVTTGDIRQSNNNGRNNDNKISIGNVGGGSNGFLGIGGKSGGKVSGNKTTTVKTGDISQSNVGGRRNENEINIGNVK